LHPDRDEPVNPGETGRIVVTDLFNYAMPLIRYDTGDMAVLSEQSVCGASGLVFTKVEGRRVDFIYDTTGNLLSPHVITNTMWKYAEVVKQFQFVQMAQNGYRINLNCGNNKFGQIDTLLSDLKSFVGKDANIEIVFVDDIPALASGKRKKIVNNYKPL
jgi:phenylacetate-CoA ligase